jgi:hypothetical protein
MGFLNYMFTFVTDFIKMKRIALHHHHIHTCTQAS